MSSNKANKSTKVGDELFIVESANAEFQIGNAIKDTSKVAGLQVDDDLRKKFGAFWTKDPNAKGKQTFFNKVTNKSPIENIEYSEPSESAEGIITQGLKIRFNQYEGQHLDMNGLMDFFNSDTFDNSFYDHATVVNIYEEGNNKVEQAAGILNLYAEAKSDYNFLEKKYENYIMENGESIEVRDLPNFYNFMLRDIEKSTSVRNRILTLGGRISLSERTPASEYYRRWIENFKDYVQSEDYRQETDVMKEILFTKSETSQLGELYKYKELFPMFNTIEFNVEDDGKFGTTLEETNFSSQLKNQLTDDNVRRVEMAEVISNMTEEITQQDGQDRFSATGVDSKTQIRERKTYNIDTLMQKYSPSNSQGIYSNEEAESDRYRAYYSLMSLIVKGRVEKIKKTVFRNYKEILDGATAYNEPIFYKIEKRDSEENLLQEFCFTNVEDLNKISFVDTQVKYGERYKYTIKSQNLVIGTEYSYTQAEKTSSHTVTVDVLARPSARIVEVPLFEKSIVISDNPPIAPEMLIIPFRAVNNRIKLFFNSSVGRYKATPILFSTNEGEFLEKYKEAQDIPSDEEEIMFETDDSVKSFILYKMNRPPKTYQDFQEFGEIVRISTNDIDIHATVRQQTEYASAASYDDNIKPNQKYYYCLRAVDYHNNISYPSPVYEFELVDDAGSVYPISRIYEFKKDSQKESNVGVKRFIHIKPTMRNLFADTVKMGIDGTPGPSIGQEVHLGLGDDPTWGKKFKMRLTSKSTGKKIDFNFSFGVKQNQAINEE